MTAQRISIRIDRLVLENVEFAAHDRRALVESIRSELTRLVAADRRLGGLAQPAAVRSLSVNNVALSADPMRLGATIARSTHGALGNAAQRGPRA